MLVGLLPFCYRLLSCGLELTHPSSLDAGFGACASYIEEFAHRARFLGGKAASASLFRLILFVVVLFDVIVSNEVGLTSRGRFIYTISFWRLSIGLKTLGCVPQILECQL